MYRKRHKRNYSLVSLLLYIRFKYERGLLHIVKGVYKFLDFFFENLSKFAPRFPPSTIYPPSRSSICFYLQKLSNIVNKKKLRTQKQFLSPSPPSLIMYSIGQKIFEKLSNLKIYMLLDPLSSVDTKTTVKLF